MFGLLDGIFPMYGAWYISPVKIDVDDGDVPFGIGPSFEYPFVTDKELA